MDHSRKILATNEKLINKARSISQKRTWLPRVLQNLFRNESKVDQLFSEVLANQNSLLSHAHLHANSGGNGHSITAQWLEQKDRLEAENRELRARLAVADQQREQIYTRPVCYFLHIPKTGGTSVTRYLADAFGPEYVLNAHHICDIMHLDRVTLRRHRLICGHFYGVLDPFLGVRTQKITFLRDPFDRAVSDILHAKRFEQSHLCDVLRQYSMEEILVNPAFAWIHHNYQARCIASLALSPYSLLDHPPEGHCHPHHVMERLRYESFSAQQFGDVASLMMTEFDFVGLTEHLGLSLKGIAEAWRLPHPSGEYTDNRNPEKRDYGSMVSDRVRKDFYRQNEIDYELWGSVRKKLALREEPSLSLVAAA